MSKTTITRIYPTYQQAQTIVTQLEAANIPHRDISLLSNSSEHAGLPDYQTPANQINSEDTYETAVGTGAIGGTVGFLTGLGLLALPGIGPVAAIGWLGATLAGFTFGAAGGAAVGAISESLSNNGVDSATAERNASALQAGGTLVAVRCDSDRLGTIEAIMGTSDSDTVTTGSSRVA